MIVLKNRSLSFKFLNATQFLGALNDNVFKLLIVFLLINLRGADQASSILASTGAIFVIPFLIFSSGAGVLADRSSKRKIIVYMKAVEIFIMVFSVIAVILKSEIGLYILLFLMAAQSAIFGPSKYGIIPEIIESKKVSKANGTLSSFTFLAIIAGTFLAAFLTDITNKNFIVCSLFCVLVACVGFLTSLGIEKTPPKRSKKRINPFFLYEIAQTLSLTYKRAYLLPAVLGSAFFLFIGGYVQLNTIPLALQSLHLTEVGGGYLFLSTAFGIALGAPLAGFFSKEDVQPGLSCFSGFMIGLLLLLLYLFSNHLITVIILLMFLGLFGGMFVVPLDSFIQMRSPEKRRGQIIAAANFLSFVGVLSASFFLYLFGSVLELKASTGFIYIALITFVFTIWMTGRFSSFFFSFLSKQFLCRLYPMHTRTILPSGSVLILEKKKWLDVFLLFSLYPELRVLTTGKRFHVFPYFNALFNTLFMASSSKKIEKRIKKLLSPERKVVLCLFLKKSEISKYLLSFVERYGYNPFFVRKERIKVFSRYGLPSKKFQFVFSKKPFIPE